MPKIAGYAPPTPLNNPQTFNKEVFTAASKGKTASGLPKETFGHLNNLTGADKNLYSVKFDPNSSQNRVDVKV